MYISYYTSQYNDYYCMLAVSSILLLLYSVYAFNYVVCINSTLHARYSILNVSIDVGNAFTALFKLK